MSMRWTGLGVLMAAVVGCRGPSGPERLPGPEADGAAGPRPADAGPGDAGGIDARGSDAGAVDAAAADAGDASQSLCPAPGAPRAGADIPAAPWSPPTAVPFSCAPMPSALFLPRPGADVAGAYARCASFADARVVSLAVNRDGSRVALLGVDGVVRVVDVASRAVVGVLAPPRASVGLATFSPGGDTILTVARGERQVTLWRADTFAPLWTTTLLGHTYDQEQSGAAAFSPDGTAALVSPGAALYLLDAATGAIRAASAQLSGAVLNAAYGWQGRRIAVLTAPVTGMCSYSPHGGMVTTLDPRTLTPIATPMAWPLQGDEAPDPGQFLVAADADLIVTSGLDTYPPSPPGAFRLSDGSPLPAPPIDTFPLALSPDGTAAVIGGPRALELVRLADGASIASTTAAAPTAVAFSADGSTIAAGSSGGDLLGIWQPASGPMIPTCTAEARVSEERDVKTALSADGASIAVDWGPQIRVINRADGSLASTIDHADQPTFWLTLSPDARYVVGEFANLPASPDFPMAVFRTSDGAQVADLGSRYAFQGGSWSSFFFPPDGLRLYGSVHQNGAQDLTVVVQVDLETGAASSKLLVSGWVSLVGTSGDCPLIIDPSLTLVRACGGCQPLPLARNTGAGVVSLDGGAYLSLDGDGTVTGTTLWSIGARPGVLRHYPLRPEEATWNPREAPVAISAHGGRVITAAQAYIPCYSGPSFTSRVHDVATDTVIDDLPPRITSTSADLAVIAYGPVLWCAR
jgi:WD40 repeat protein